MAGLHCCADMICWGDATHDGPFASASSIATPILTLSLAVTMQVKELFLNRVGLEELFDDESAADMTGAGRIRFRSLVDTLPVVVYAVQVEPPYAPIYVSHHIESLGYSEEEWVTTPDLWLRLIHDDDRQRIMDETEKA